MREQFGELKRSGRGGFIPFITTGDPDLATTERLLIELANAGADLIESRQGADRNHHRGDDRAHLEHADDEMSRAQLLRHHATALLGCLYRPAHPRHCSDPVTM